jgi:hypothetical protein
MSRRILESSLTLKQNRAAKRAEAEQVHESLGHTGHFVMSTR